jgi:ribosomal protein S13
MEGRAMTTSVLFHTLPAAEAYARGEGVIHGIDDRLGDIIGYRVEIEETERIKRLELEETERIKRLVLGRHGSLSINTTTMSVMTNKRAVAW